MPARRSVLRRLLFAIAAVAVAFSACGGDKRGASKTVPADTPTASATVRVLSPQPSPTARAAKTATPVGGAARDTALGGLFNTVFQGALSGGEGLADSGFAEGDASLAQYLPTNDDLPPGYTPSAQYT